MSKTKLLAIAVLISGSAMAQKAIIARNPQVIKGEIVKPINPNKIDPNWKNVKARDERGIIGREDGVDNQEYEPSPRFLNLTNQPDRALQTSADNKSTIATQNAGYDGIGYTSVCPADPSVAVGPNHVIQMINGGSGAYFQIWDKSGAAVGGAAIYMDAITGRGGLGDPVVLYDQLANRFVMTEFANKPETGAEGLIFAISKTATPGKTPGDWYVYFFSTSLFPDYPKFSVWGDAYYCKTNDFRRNTYNGASIWAFDRTKMLAGLPATVQIFALGKANKFYSACPVGLSGTTQAPAGTGGMFAYLNPKAWSGSVTDSIGLLECDVNFTTASLSTVSVARSLAVATYTTGPSSVTQPSTATIDALANRVMNQPQYRNFGTSASIVMTHLSANGSSSAMRWYELTNTGTWSVKQQSTYAPDATNRFMGSININAAGDIALMYNASSKTVFPSLRFTVRKSTDALNTMPAEGILKAGTVSSSCANRYGDYNHLVVDPAADNLTFWATGMYNKAASWSTFVSSFNVSGSTGPLPVVSAATTLETKTFDLVKATLYPNPVSKVLTITVNEKVSGTQLQIIDLSGKVMMSRKVQNGATQLDLGSYAPGVYGIKLTNGGKTSMQKFVKE